MKNKIYPIVILVAILLFISGFALVKNTEQIKEQIGGVKVELQEFIGGLTVEGQTVVDEFTQGGGVLTITATSTQSAYTLTADQMRDNNVISIANVASPALSLTLPAVSTMTRLIPDVGDTREWFIQNLHSNAATTTTVLAGTGIDLQGDATGDDVINGAVFGRLTCYRQSASAVVCFVLETVAAD